MEILELLMAGPEFCGCMLEILALGVDSAAAVKGVRMSRTVKARKDALARGEEPLRTPSWLPFIALVCFGLFFTILVAYKWLRTL